VQMATRSWQRAHVACHRLHAAVSNYHQTKAPRGLNHDRNLEHGAGQFERASGRSPPSRECWLCLSGTGSGKPAANLDIY
jgi:hypothetical protein